MYHEIMVKSKHAAIEYAEDFSIPKCIVISINGYGDYIPDFFSFGNPAILDCISLTFDDEERGNNAMTSDDAHEILDFVSDWVDEDVEILVHCGAGVSRSAGVAAALGLLLNGDDSLVFDDGRYSPNMHCYRTMLQAAGLSYSEEEVDAKYERQFGLWLELARTNGVI